MITSTQIQHCIVIQFLLVLVLLLIWQQVNAQPGTVTATGSDNKQFVAALDKTSNSVAAIKPAASFKQVDTFPGLIQTGKLERQDIPNPHWEKNGCIACHITTADKASAKNIRHKPVEKTCDNCHSAEFDHRYIHPTDVQPDKKMLARMERNIKSPVLKQSNKIGCTTCHDLTLQCQSNIKKHKRTNPMFFRNGPYKRRSQLCFLCHDETQYQRLNPHEQINEKGQVIAEKCRICHVDSLDRLRQVKNIDQLEFNAKESFSTMCWGCHPWTPHPGGQFTFFKKDSGPDHLIKPSKLIKDRLARMTEKNQINFPLEPNTGKVFCNTCHNVHQKGVIKNQANAKGADSKKRLRAQKICQYCHLM